MLAKLRKYIGRFEPALENLVPILNVWNLPMSSDFRGRCLGWDACTSNAGEHQVDHSPMINLIEGLYTYTCTYARVF